ncbi:MAG: hypothetical protein EP329_03335 [Deltaproteobacteria bacterium]|nr:MAG: hypothetical protein EP329_03335 [Deltaproteobacteria bacterium]
MFRRLVVPLSLLSLVAACGDSGSTDGADSVDQDTTADTVEADTTPAPWTPETLEERGYVEVRAIIHLHSAYSHDACDDEGLDDNGTPNWPCIRRMKASLCKEHIGVAFMTDHPSHMNEQPFEDLLYAEEDKGDELLTDDAGVAWGVRFACPDGQGGPDGSTVLVPGFEGTHTMPIGLRQHLEMRPDYGISLVDGTSFEAIEDMVADVRASGGMVTIAHSEQDDIPASMIIEHDIPLMELYNFHANFNSVLGENLATALISLELFLGTTPIPRSDLTALVMLGTYPVKALEKWRTVSAVRPITAFAGSDVHENVVIPAICANTSNCDDLALTYPNLVRALEKGGNVMLSDGERLDAYERIFRWVQNRVLVTPGSAMPAGAEEALEAGRNIVVFEVLGDALGASILALTGSEDAPEYHDMGSTVTVADGATLWARSPDVPVPGNGAYWVDGSAAIMSATIYKTDAEGTTAVQTWSEPGTWVSLPLDAKGSYHLEVTLIPHHLASELGDMAELCEGTYRWVETNAVRVE